ncbi:MAG: restriction endonuclease, partial [Candidatus Cloacimonetes bacterium]|nr:restriction endonuclease [Candidatus Cloacimonadota bacterium]
TAWDKEKEDSAEQNKTEQDTETQDRGIVTTEEELESFYIVKAILISHIPGNRISYRDAKTLFSILLDNNIRKPICKLIFSDKRKVLVLFEADRTEVRVSLESIDDIYKHADKLLNTLSFYEK